MPNIDLTTAERDALARALRTAFYNQDELAQLVYFGLGERLDDVAPPGTLPARVMAVIQWAEASGRTDETVQAARARRPGNPKLTAFVKRYGASAQRQVTQDALERLTDSAIRLKQPALWRDQMARAESCVCRVLVAGMPVGTGFLAGPGLVITNHHVIEHAGGPIEIELGYRNAADGTAEAAQRHAVTGPAVFAQPDSAVDREQPKSRLATRDELDVAVLPVAGEPELTVVDGRPRGTLAPARTPRLTAGDLITIIQHPLGEHLQFAYDRVLEINTDRTRVTYKVQTRPGSSGSPCFDADWNLVAIHHSGDPRTSVALGEYNEGIPIATLQDCLPRELVARLGWSA